MHWMALCGNKEGITVLIYVKSNNLFLWTAPQQRNTAILCMRM